MKKCSKSFATYDFSTLFTKLPHDKLKSKLSSIPDFAFNKEDKTFIRLFNNGAAYWGKKTKGRLGFSKTSLKTAINYLIENSYFNAGNMTKKQALCIPMGIDPALFGENLFFIPMKKNTGHH